MTHKISFLKKFHLLEKTPSLSSSLRISFCSWPTENISFLEESKNASKSTEQNFLLTTKTLPEGRGTKSSRSQTQLKADVCLRLTCGGHNDTVNLIPRSWLLTQLSDKRDLRSLGEMANPKTGLGNKTRWSWNILQLKKCRKRSGIYF